MDQLTVGVVISTASLRQEIQQCIFDLPVRVVLDQSSIQEWGLFIDKLERAQPDVLLIDLQELRDPLGDVVRQIKSTSSHPAVIVVDIAADSEKILKAIRATADEFLFPPLRDDLRRALERISTSRVRIKAGTTPRGKVLGFLAAKGGCGASTLAVHLAASIREQCKLHVLLADLDLESGIVGFLMKSTGRYTLLDAVENIHRLDLSFWQALVSNGGPGVEVILSPGAPFFSRNRTIEDFTGILRFTRSVYDWSVVDLGCGLTLLAKAVLEEVDDLVLVTQMEIPALHQTKLILRSLLDLGFAGHRIKVVVNRMPKRGDVTVQELEGMLGMSIFATVPSDYASLHEAYAEGRLLHPRSKIGKVVGELAERISGVAQAEPRKKRFLFSLA
jgi:pilus assembly protein CpaE